MHSVKYLPTTNNLIATQFKFNKIILIPACCSANLAKWHVPLFSALSLCVYNFITVLLTNVTALLIDTWTLLRFFKQLVHATIWPSNKNDWYWICFHFVCHFTARLVISLLKWSACKRSSHQIYQCFYANVTNYLYTIHIETNVFDCSHMTLVPHVIPQLYMDGRHLQKVVMVLDQQFFNQYFSRASVFWWALCAHQWVEVICTAYEKLQE